jgi:hypothetical protein
MFPRVTEVRPLERYRLELVFTDGTRGEVDLSDWVVGQRGVFAPLGDPALFREVRVNAELGTIQWPNGADLCPDVLYSRATGRPIAAAQADVVNP